MTIRKKFRWFLAVLVVTACAFGAWQVRQWRKPLGAIEFFGSKGINVEPIRAALPIHEGDLYPPFRQLAAMALTHSSEGLRRRISDKVKEIIGREPTDVSFVCCDSNQNWLLYIGLSGESSKNIVFNSVPAGDIRLPPEVLKLEEQMVDAIGAAIMSGHSAEDDSEGYSLTNDPKARKKELEMREYALHNEALILRVLASSSDAGHRAIAAQALGYGRQSGEQIDALVHASLDPDDGVRNDATRALWVLAGAKPDLARRIPAGPFIQLLRSGTWSDHNKGSLLLEALTRLRDLAVLGQLRSEALDSLIEMARWRNVGHAFAARMMLGRIAGIEEDRLAQLLATDQVDPILAALTPVH